MRVTVNGVPGATVGNIVCEITAQVAAIEERPARVDNGKTFPGFTEIAIIAETGMFVINAYESVPLGGLQAGERYAFTCEISNDSYGKAKQPRVTLLAFRPYVKPAGPAPKATPGTTP